MTEQAAKLIARLEAELKFSRRHVNNLNTQDFEEVDELNMSFDAMRDALDALRLELEPACEEIPAGVSYPAAA